MVDTADTRLGARLRLEREARGWSLSDLAARSGVSRAMINKVERGESSPTAALLGRLSGAFGTGYTIGSGISWLIEHFAPNLNDAIGDTIASMTENFWDASGEVEEGHYEAAFDDLFGFPVTSSSDPWGDWDISDPMMYYYQTTNSCGF